jgi:hypothetical protein
MRLSARLHIAYSSERMLGSYSITPSSDALTSTTRFFSVQSSPGQTLYVYTAAPASPSDRALRKLAESTSPQASVTSLDTTAAFDTKQP